ncbi:hypothetical protein ACFV4N_28040 [Actinosynnema sp. NPDC059797]
MRISAALAALCLLAGCSATDAPRPSAPEDTALPRSTPTTTSSNPLAAFCQDLDVVDVALVAFSADVSRPIVRGGGLADLSEARRMAGIVVERGRVLLPQAPPDIADELSAVIAATEEAVGHLGTSDTAALLAASQVMYRDQVTTARDTISGYPPCG